MVVVFDHFDLVDSSLAHEIDIWDKILLLTKILFIKFKICCSMRIQRITIRIDPRL